MIQKTTAWNRRARINVENQLKFNGVDQGVKFPATSANTFDGSQELTFNWFVSSAQYLDAFDTIYAQHDSTTQGINIYTYPVGGQLRVLVRIRGAVANVDHTHTILDGLHLQEQESMFTVKIRGELFTGGNTETDLYINGKYENSIITTFSVGDFTPSLTDFYIGITPNGAIRTSAALANFTIFNKGLTEDEIQAIFVNGGQLPKTTHENCVAHYPLTQNRYFKADAPFIVNNPQFIVGDLVAWDAVEQYNYAKPIWSVPPLSLWTLGGGFSVTTEQLTYDGTQAGSRSSSATVNNMATSDNKKVRVTFNVVSNTGEFWIFGGGSAPTGDKIGITGTGPQDVEIQFTGTAKLFFANNNGVTVNNGDVWTVENVVVYGSDLNANHGKLVNFADSEVGAGAFQAESSSIKDFYSKKINRQLGVQSLIQAYTADAINTYFYDKGSVVLSDLADWTFLVVVRQPGNFFESSGGGSVLAVANQNYSSSAGQLSNRSPQSGLFRFRQGGQLFDLTISKKQRPRFSKIGFYIFGVSYSVANDELKVLYNVPSNDSLYDKAVYDTTINPVGNSGNGLQALTQMQTGKTIFSDILITDSFITDGNEADVMNLNFDSLTSVFLHWKFGLSDDITTVKDISGNGRDGNLVTDGNSVTPKPAPMKYQPVQVDILSAMPPPLQSLNFDNTWNIRIPLEVSKEIATGPVSFMIRYKLNAASNVASGTQIWAGFNGAANLRFYAVSTGLVRVQNESTIDLMPVGEKRENISTLVLTNSMEVVQVLENAVYQDGTLLGRPKNISIPDLSTFEFRLIGAVGGMEILGFALWSKVLSQEEAAQYSDNLNFKNPIQRGGLLCSYNFNEESFYHDGTNVRIKNWAEPRGLDFWNINSFSIWTQETGMFSDNGQRQLTYDGTAVAASRAYRLPVTAISQTNYIGKKLSFMVEVLNNTGSLVFYVGSATSNAEKITITGTGIFYFDALYEAGAMELTFANTDGVINYFADTWEINANFTCLGFAYDARIDAGLTGATVQDKLNDVPNHLTDIDQLR